MVKVRCFISLAFCAVLSTAVICNAQSDDKEVHAIDKTQAACLKTHHGTMPRAECYSAASEAWEKDVTQTYAALVKAMPEDKQKAVETSQKAWEAYRDAEFGLIATMYNSKKGTGYISVRIILRMDVVKARALQLESWLASVKGSE